MGKLRNFIGLLLLTIAPFAFAQDRATVQRAIDQHEANCLQNHAEAHMQQGRVRMRTFYTAAEVERMTPDMILYLEKLQTCNVHYECLQSHLKSLYPNLNIRTRAQGSTFYDEQGRVIQRHSMPMGITER